MTKLRGRSRDSGWTDTYGKRVCRYRVAQSHFPPPKPRAAAARPAVSPSPLRTLISDLATVLPFPERRGVGISPRASPADRLLPAAVCALTFPRGRPGLVGFSAPWSLWASRRDHASIASRTERPRGPDAVDGASPLSRRA